jgi:hypothetical protein
LLEEGRHLQDLACSKVLTPFQGKLLEEVFREYPYLKETNIEQQIKYIKDAAAHKV